MKGLVAWSIVLVGVAAAAYVVGQRHDREVSNTGGSVSAEAAPRPADGEELTGEDPADLHGRLIYFAPETVELGKVLWRSHVPFSAWFVNDSHEPITIESLSAGCSCTVVNADDCA